MLTCQLASAQKGKCEFRGEIQRVCHNPLSFCLGENSDSGSVLVSHIEEALLLAPLQCGKRHAIVKYGSRGLP